MLALLGVFYLLPPIYAVLGRAYGAEADDTVVLELPRLMLDGLSGDLLTGVVTAGAFAAFLSTSSGLAIAVSGVIAQDVLGGRLPGVSAFRVAATFAVGVPLAAAVLAPDLSVARAVGLAFAVAASTFCPLLVLGIWWRGLTPAGAVAGLLTGGLGAGAGVAWTLYDGAPESWRDVLLGQPAAWSVPLAFAAMVGVSLLTREAVPGHASRFMVRLHTPEVVPLDRDEPGRRSSHRNRPFTDSPPPPGAASARTGHRSLSALLLCGASHHFSRGFVMTTDAPGAPPAHDHASRHDPVYDELHESADFVELRRRFRIFVFPATAAFLGWYLLYVVMSNWADDFMSTKVVGQHQRRPGLRPAAVRHDVLPRLALLQVHEPQRRPAGPRRRAPLQQREQRRCRAMSSETLATILFIVVVAHHRRDHLLGQPAEQDDRRLLRRRPQLQRLPERPGHLRRLHVAPRRSSASPALIALAGYDGFLYSIGFLVAWLVALLLVAELLRNSGRYTMADQLAFRMKQRPVRTAAATSTVVVSIFYLLAQMVGAGALVTLLLGVEGEFAKALTIVVVGALMVFYVTVGGMKGTTWVQIVKAVLLISGTILITVLVLAKFDFNLSTCSARPPTTAARARRSSQPGLKYGATTTSQIDFLSPRPGPGARHGGAAAHPDPLLHGADGQGRAHVGALGDRADRRAST